MRILIPSRLKKLYDANEDFKSEFKKLKVLFPKAQCSKLPGLSSYIIKLPPKTAEKINGIYGRDEAKRLMDNLITQGMAERKWLRDRTWKFTIYGLEEALNFYKSHHLN